MYGNNCSQYSTNIKKSTYLFKFKPLTIRLINMACPKAARDEKVINKPFKEIMTDQPTNRST